MVFPPSPYGASIGAPPPLGPGSSPVKWRAWTVPQSAVPALNARNPSPSPPRSPLSRDDSYLGWVFLPANVPDGRGEQSGTVATCHDPRARRPAGPTRAGESKDVSGFFPEAAQEGPSRGKDQQAGGVPPESAQLWPHSRKTNCRRSGSLVSGGGRGWGRGCVCVCVKVCAYQLIWVGFTESPYLLTFPQQFDKKCPLPLLQRKGSKV